MLEVDLWGKQCCHSVTWERLFTSLLLKGPRPGPSGFGLFPRTNCSLPHLEERSSWLEHHMLCLEISKWFQWFQVSGGFDTPFLIFFGIANKINHGILGVPNFKTQCCFIFYCLDDPVDRNRFLVSKEASLEWWSLKLWMLGNSVISRKVTTCLDEFTAPPRQVSSLSFSCFFATGRVVNVSWPVHLLRNFWRYNKWVQC